MLHPFVEIRSRAFTVMNRLIPVRFGNRREETEDEVLLETRDSLKLYQVDIFLCFCFISFYFRFFCSTLSRARSLSLPPLYSLFLLAKLSRQPKTMRWQWELLLEKLLRFSPRQF